MNKYILTRTIFMAALLLLAACSQDELTDNTGTLPEGQYPVEIASVTISGEGSVQPWGARSPQTRAEESADGNTTQWEVEDVFYVSDGDRIGTYRIEETEGSYAAKGVEPLYWQSKTEEKTLVAWYTEPELDMANEGTIDLSNQSGGLVYVLRTDNMVVGYNNGAAVSLQFKHQLAKVRVYVQGTAYDGNATGVQINDVPTKCTVTDGTPVDAAVTGTIAMHPATVNGTACFEANLLPGMLAKENAFTVSLQDGTSHTFSLSSDLTLTADNRHDVTLKLHKKGTQEIDLSEQSQTYEISGDGTYFFTGTGSNGIKVTDGDPTIYLANANISVSNGNAIDITGGSPTIIVQGSSSVASGSGAGIYVAQNSTVTIKGSSQKDKLTATGGNGSAGIGGYINNNMFVACGNIKIDNITLSAQGNRDPVGTYSPGIGGMGNAACGTISIRNAIVHAYASYISLQSAPAIGMGSYAYETGSSILTIQIENSTIYAHRGAYADYIGQFGNINDDKGGRVLFGTNGYCKSSTVYCYTSDTLDKTVKYDAGGNEI